MRNFLFLFLFCFCSTFLIAQAPAGFNFQGVAKDGNAVVIGSVGLQLTLHQSTADGSIVYQERHFPTTNNSGVFTVSVGSGTVINGDFSTIDWSTGPYFMQTELDAMGGSNYTDMGTSQLLSVPYALYAEQTGASTWEDDAGNIHYANGDVGVGVTTPLAQLHVEDNDVPFNQGVIVSNYTHDESVDGIAVRGTSVPTDYYGIGGRFTGGYMGVQGFNNPTGDGVYYGVYGAVSGGEGTNYAVYGSAFGGTSSYAGYFSGALANTGTAYLGGVSTTSAYSVNVPELGVYDGSTLVAVLDNTTVGSGFMGTRGTNGNYNMIVSSLSGFPNNGYFAIRDASNTNQAGIYVNSSGQGVVWGDIKDFRMEHPTDPSKEIWYASIEGPEAAAYERGTATLVSGEATINFSEHFGHVANESTMTVIITPLSAESKGIAVTAKTNDGFSVKELFNGTGNYSFDWEVKCVRAGYENFRVIRDAAEMQELLNDTKARVPVQETPPHLLREGK